MKRGAKRSQNVAYVIVQGPLLELRRETCQKKCVRVRNVFCVTHRPRAPPIIKGDEKSTIYAKGTFLSFWQQILKVALVYRLSTMHHISLGARPK